MSCLRDRKASGLGASSDAVSVFDFPPKHDEFGCDLLCVAPEPVKPVFDALNLKSAFFQIAGGRADRWRMGLRLHSFVSIFPHTSRQLYTIAQPSAHAPSPPLLSDARHRRA